MPPAGKQAYWEQINAILKRERPCLRVGSFGYSERDYLEGSVGPDEWADGYEDMIRLLQEESRRVPAYYSTLSTLSAVAAACRNCQQLPPHHAADKCLYSPDTYKPFGFLQAARILSLRPWEAHTAIDCVKQDRAIIDLFGVH